MERRSRGKKLAIIFGSLFFLTILVVVVGFLLLERHLPKPFPAYPGATYVHVTSIPDQAVFNNCSGSFLLIENRVLFLTADDESDIIKFFEDKAKQENLHEFKGSMPAGGVTYCFSAYERGFPTNSVTLLDYSQLQNLKFGQLDLSQLHPNTKLLILTQGYIDI